MRPRQWVVACGIVLAGCFDEGGDAQRTAAAVTVADGLLAFPDVSNNLTADPAAAGDALFKFIKTPIAAQNLIAPPFDLAGISPAARTNAAPTDVPDCLDTTGPAGCDSFTTNSQCMAGGFTFTGTASRTCSPCDNVTGVCTYGWDLDLGYVANDFNLQLKTKGPISVSPSSITIDTHFQFNLTTGSYALAGELDVKSCGAITVNPGPPRRMVNSSFTVVDAARSSCALVKFDAQGNVSVADRCDCP